jgi:hypothetical protein
MATTLDEVSKAALSLSSENHVRQADRLVESLDTSAVGRHDEVWVVEATQQLADLRSGRVPALPGRHVLTEARYDEGM